MRTYKTEGDLASVNKLLELAEKLNCPIDSFEGSLLDNYIIYNTEKIKIGNVKGRKYIILAERYLNSWSSTTDVIMTDSIYTVNEYERMFNKE